MGFLVVLKIHIAIAIEYQKFLPSHRTKFFWYVRHETPSIRPVPFYDFTLFVVLSLFTGGSPNARRKYPARVGGTGREKREDNKQITQNGIGLPSIFQCCIFNIDGHCQNS